MILHVDHIVPLTSDYARTNRSLAEYLGSNDVSVLVDAKWVEDENERFHQHGSVRTRYWRLKSWDLLEIRLDGTAINTPHDVPNDFPMPEVIAIAEGGALRDELERQGANERKR